LGSPSRKNIAFDACENLVVIGASSGGPSAIAEVLSRMPPDFPSAILVAQHLDKHFSSGLAEWLGHKSRLPVQLACEGDLPIRGKVLVAGTNDHLHFVSSRALGYTSEPTSNPYRPSVDVLFHSVVRHWKGKAVGVLLTGMGSDGACGLKAMREAGFLTIAQNEATSAVYGMPKAAAQLEAASIILPLSLISSTLIQHFCPASSTPFRKNFNHERVP
jgi:chemotaxis response regulator CheB